MNKPERPVEDRFGVAVRWLTAAALAIVAVVPLVGNELRVQDWDPQFARNIIERVARFGGTFYENGIYNKGPLEPLVYSVARHLGGYDGMWLFVSVFSAIAALICGFVAARACRWTGAPAVVALATGTVLYVHLTLSGSDYAGVLYARNMTVTLLAIGWALTFEERLWRSPRGRRFLCIACGVALGLVAQTLVSEVFAAAAIGVALLVLVVHRADAAERRLLLTRAIGSAAVAFFATPAWYALRGSFLEYWTSWYGHGHLMAVGTRRSLGSQIALGWRQMYAYYHQRPLALLVIVTFVVFAYVRWPRADVRERAMTLSLLGWFAGSWIEQVLNQRYSSHYFVINTIPTALMAAVLVGHAARAASSNPRFLRVATALPLAAVVGTIYVSGAQEFRDAAKRTSQFTSVGALAREEAQGKAGAVKSARGVLDLVSADNDPILAWTNTPWAYLDVHRVAAGRFIWKSFLVGEIYLGSSGPEYVLPHMWDWFREDVRRSRPAAFLKTEDDPAPGTPFADLIKQEFQLVYGGGQKVYLRNDVARRLVSAPPAARPWVPSFDGSPAPDWEVGTGTARHRGAPTSQSSDALVVAGRNCIRVDGVAANDGGALPAFDVLLDDQTTTSTDDHESFHLKLQGDKASAGTDAGEYESVASGVQAGNAAPVNFSIVVGRRAAALVVGGQVRAATTIPSSVTVSVAPLQSSLNLTELRTSAVSELSGC